MEGSQSLGSGTSKKRSRASRTVAGLSDEQIRHKRTVDRKAQRAFRQRTKDFIGNLERQFAQLQETCAQQEMELSTLREQNKSLQQRLDSIRDILSGNQTVQIDSDIRDRGEPTIRAYLYHRYTF